jgi:hypothetical protein
MQEFEPLSMMVMRYVCVWFRKDEQYIDRFRQDYILNFNGVEAMVRLLSPDDDVTDINTSSGR